MKSIEGLHGLTSARPNTGPFTFFGRLVPLSDAYELREINTAKPFMMNVFNMMMNDNRSGFPIFSVDNKNGGALFAQLTSENNIALKSDNLIEEGQASAKMPNSNLEKVTVILCTNDFELTKNFQNSVDLLDPTRTVVNIMLADANK